MMNRKIIDYTVITACDSGALTNSVFDHIKKGWQPLGGVCLAIPEDSDLNLFTWQVGDLVLTELTTRAEPSLLGFFE